MRIGQGKLYRMFENLYRRGLINSGSLLIFKSTIEYQSNYKIPSAVLCISWDVRAYFFLCFFSS